MIRSFFTTFQELTAKPISDSARKVLLAGVIGLVLLIRLATIGNPSLKWTAWKEIDYIYISQNYWQNGFDFFHPEVGWPAEPPRVTEMEIPLVPFVTALLYQVFGFSAYTARALTLVSFLVLMVYLYKLTARELGTVTGVLAAFAVGVLPLYHPFGRFIFTEPVMITMSCVSLYYMAEWVEGERKREWWLALITFSLTAALKLESLYLFLPIGWLAFRKYGWNIKQYVNLVILIALALILPVLWYAYAYYLETTGAHLFGIFMGHNKSQMLMMLSNPQWYRVMAGRVINGILGGLPGFALFAAGVGAAAWSRKGGLFFAWLAAVFAYFALVAEGNIDAPYRQLPLISSAAVFLALGVQAVFAAGLVVIRFVKKNAFDGEMYPFVGLLAGLGLVFLIPLMNVGKVIGFTFPMHTDRWELAQELANYTDENTKLVMLGEYSKHVGGYDLSPVIYYYTGTQGWTLTPERWTVADVQALAERGATLLVNIHQYNTPADVNYQQDESPDALIAELKLLYPVLYEHDDEIIFDLTGSVK